MIRKITLILLAVLGWSLATKAQPVCGFDAIHQHQLATNPAYAQQIQDNTTNWGQYAQNASNALILNTPGGTIYEIPVVVHIMHTGGAVGSIYNPTDAQITGMIDYLNKSYAAQYTGYPDTNSGGTYIPVRFKLAARDPNCNPTTGIVRYNMSAVTAYVNNGVNQNNSNGIADLTLKNYDRWPPNEYYNIWVVNRIDGADGTVGTFIAGYAYFATSAGTNVDGTIMLATQAQAGSITLPHEIGHALGIYHVFQGGSTTVCPTNTNCNTQGDQVCDTEPQKQSPFNCPTGINSCTGVAWQNGQHNFMDYSSCQDRFTPGQRTKMIYNLQLYRLSLISSLGSVPPSGATPATACTPTITNPTNTFNFGPRNVVLNDLNASSDGYNGDGNMVYVNKVCLQRANMVLGGAYNLSVTCGSANAENVRVYIDYNNDGTFAAGELIYSGATTTANPTVTATYNVPTSGVTTCTPLRMRVFSDVTSNTTMNICGPVTYGQMEDYSVYFRPAGSIGNVSIALTSGTNPSCVGTSLTFTATPSANVTNPTYKWFVNNVYTGVTTSTYTSTTLANNSVVKVQMFYTTTGGCYADSAFSNAITVTRSTSGAAGVTLALTSGTNPGCAGQSLTFTATPTNGGSAPTYDFKKNGITQQSGTSATYTTTSLVNGDVVTVTITSNSTCVSPLTATSTGITISTTNVTPTVSIALISGNNPGCPGQSMTFFATPVNGGTAPVYQWYINSTLQSATTATFVTNALVNGDIVTVKMTSNLACASTTPVTSNAITFTVAPITPSVSMAITSGSNPGCPGQPLTFTATPVNGGATPAYQWKVNGVTQSTANPFTTSTLAAGDVVTVTMTSSDACATTAPVTSNSITISFNVVTPSVSIALTGGSSNPSCAGSVVNFTATPVNGGSSPAYVWKINGNPNGVTTPTFSSTTIANADVISVTMTSSNACAVPSTVTSNTIAMTIIPVDTPKVTVAITKGSNPGCKDSLIEFTATAAQAGSSPSYAWLLNNVVTSTTGNVYSSTSLLNGDVIVARITITGPGCRVSNTALSDPITLVRNTTPVSPVISLIGNMLVANASNVQWYGPNGLIPGATSQNYHPTTAGYYYCVATNSGCNSAPSNKLLISLLDIRSYNLDEVSIYPNPTTGTLVIDWGTKTADTRIEVFNTMGQSIRTEEAKNVSRKLIDLSGLANGNYFIVLHDQQGNTGTRQITIRK